MKKFIISLIISLIVVLFFPLVLSNIFNLFNIKIEYEKPVSPPWDFVPLFTIDSLIQHPYYYHNKPIKVYGFVQLGFEHSALYKYDYFKLPEIDTSRAFWLNINPKDSLIFNYQEIEYDLRDVDIKSFYKIFDNKVVEIVGTFNSDNKGHFDLYLGSIENISSIKIYIKNFPGIII